MTPRNSPSILIIEDDDQLQGLYQDLFTQVGYVVTLADSAQSGLQSARDTHPDFIILDIMLPGGQNGFDVLEQLKRDPQLKSIPVLVITNLDHQRDIALTIGAVDCLVKTDITPTDIMAKIKSYLPISSPTPSSG
ncbi:hypothetical protein A2634_01750 [Candidatus Amesbacteria bacterium RIFCSPHIGHO2_01_FULL_48_32]|uniref:Response regulatory domain-containing protein n=1 Tax=Candidatus Amesbacteria bacterium RIFCSPLOWO2_01_FULL_48_25 TaxID=1797259 RepID=A0A1F4ZAT8_9BACT|nr:MAG: hypothetical protein A2634_01750 [Candidatus Amesbacteria bacterium RIFCSPHIGHO2_01_FULL_48_32]OGD03383.1 MAG: hypothetical protein A2989_00950 [Candidatus Amesbacteria bacterium RIFCSPLOWO2_01_FULL_48_25]HJZ05000.1 response regulator [Patescibacteria group bacterium]